MNQLTLMFKEIQSFIKNPSFFLFNIVISIESCRPYCTIAYTTRDTGHRNSDVYKGCPKYKREFLKYCTIMKTRSCCISYNAPFLPTLNSQLGQTVLFSGLPITRCKNGGKFKSRVNFKYPASTRDLN